MQKKRKIELLSPAGDLERLKTAVVFGADAVYCGLPDWSLRNPREITFNLETLRKGIEFAHSYGVKVYLTFNIFPHENQLKEIEKTLIRVKKALFYETEGSTFGNSRRLNLRIPDAVILSDLGMLALVKKYLPKVEIHISTQANTLNSEAVKIWKELGAKRIVLAREVTLDEIKKIKQKLKIENCKLEIEVFGHGAMCMAYSGRCLLSKYFTGREANLGDCAQSCRWRYKVKSEKCKPENKGAPSARYFIEEETRPGDLLEVQEDKNGTYFMNSKEICAIDIIDKFIESGIDSLKIEGRAKTVYYLATVTRAYRKAIDLYYAGKLTKKTVAELYKELNLIQNRGYSHGFLMGKYGYEQEYKIAAFKPPVIFIGIIQKSKIKNQKSGAPSAQYLVEVKNKFRVGENIEIVMPDEIVKAKILEIKNEKGRVLEEILTPQEKVWVKFDLKKKIPERSILRRKIFSSK